MFPAYELAKVFKGVVEHYRYAEQETWGTTTLQSDGHLTAGPIAVIQIKSVQTFQHVKTIIRKEKLNPSSYILRQVWFKTLKTLNATQN